MDLTGVTFLDYAGVTPLLTHARERAREGHATVVQCGRAASFFFTHAERVTDLSALSITDARALQDL